VGVSPGRLLSSAQQTGQRQKCSKARHTRPPQTCTSPPPVVATWVVVCASVRDPLSVRARYSFGIVVWEVCSLQTPFEEHGLAHIAMRVAVQHRRPLVPPQSRRAAAALVAGQQPGRDLDDAAATVTDDQGQLWPPHLVALMYACWAKDPAQRPPFATICKVLGNQGRDAATLLRGVMKPGSSDVV